MNDITLPSRFKPVTSVGPTGDLTVGAGRYSRAAIITAFEMNGGVEAFADWAEENKTEFYTKLFPKLIGREAVETAPKSDDVEDLLSVLDLEADDITDVDDEKPVSSLHTLLAEKAALYAAGEVEAD